MGKGSCLIWPSFAVTQFFIQVLFFAIHCDTLALQGPEYKNDTGTGFVMKLTSCFATGCPHQWDNFGNKCYQVFGSLPRDRKSWRNAENSCADHGSTLVSIHSAKEQDMLSSYASRLHSDIWIGMHLARDEYIFEWVDGTEFEFHNWQRDEPSYVNGEGDCVKMGFKPELGKWYDYMCDTILPYICQKPQENI